jgi:hypothetical protein
MDFAASMPNLTSALRADVTCQHQKCNVEPWWAGHRHSDEQKRVIMLNVVVVRAGWLGSVRRDWTLAST